MTFAQPLWIIAGLIVCIGTLLLLHNLQAKRMATLEKFAAANLLEKLTRNVSTRRQLVKKTIFVLALFCCFLALARPQYGFRWEDVKRKGIDILFALDTSKSMLTEDVKPNRLERAKLAITDFVDQLDGDRVGLIPFAGSAYLMCPLTGDYQAFENSLKEVDTNIIPKGGTDIAAAIREAETVFSDKADYKLLILVTDGENLEGNVLAEAQTAAKMGMRIFTVGVGTREGEIIPISSGGVKGFVKDPAGNFVVSHMDETTLTQIAEKCNGLYAPLGNKGQGLQTIYRKKLSLVPKEELTERRHKVPLERFQWPLTAAILLLSVEFMIGTRKSRPFRLQFGNISLLRKDKKIIGLLILLTSLSLLSWPASSRAATEGEKAYNAGDYPKASELYSRLLKKHPDDPKLQFDYGTAAYKSKKFDEAVSAFNGALKSKDLGLQEKAYYNRGNALFKKGEETLKSDNQQTLAQWQEALDSYSASLQLAPDDQDALYNRKLVQKKMDELKKNENNQQKKQDQKENEKKDQNDKQKDQQGQQGAQGSKAQQQPESQQGGQKEDEKKQDRAVKQEKTEQQKQAATQNGKAQKEAAKAEAGINKERRKEGKMTREDAEQLLNSMKNDEGKTLNFIPDSGKSNDEQPRRDW